MFTDMVGYTSISQRNEDLALSLLEKQSGILLPAIKSHGGIPVKTMGDAHLAEFESALEAVKCAVEIQSGVREYLSSASKDEHFKLRIGIHVGDVVHRDDDVFGDAVNIASRIEPLAEPGGICISQQVYDQVNNKLSLVFEKLPSQQLKNVSTRIDIYRVMLSAPVIPNQKSDVEEGALRERIAVLPLSNFSPNPQDEYLADGMTEELITAISMVEGLRVIARTSAMRLKNTDKDVSEIGRTLRVGTILEGSLRKVGEKIRVTVQLIDAKTEEHIWAQNYDGDMSDIFKIQSDIAGKVAEVLRGKLLPVSIPTQKAVNLEAYELYLKGRFFWNRRNVDGIKEALKLFQAAVEKDPNFAKAYSGIADCYSIGRELYLFERSEALNKAGISVRKALELDDSLAEAHASFGLQLVNAFQLREAEEEFNKALSLNPSYASAHHWYAICLADLGRLDDALKEASIAAQTDPLSSPARNILGVMYLYSRDYDKAIGVFTEILKMDTHFSPALLYRAIAFSCKKMEEECMKDVMRSIELSKDEYVNHQMLSYFLAVFGHMDDAMKEFDQAEKLAPNEEGLLDLRTGFFGCAGNNDGFYKWIVPALESKIIRPSDIRYSPWLDKMREDPRYNQLVERFLS